MNRDYQTFRSNSQWIQLKAADNSINIIYLDLIQSKLVKFN